MKVVSPNGMINQLNSHHLRPATLDRNGRRKDGDSISAVHMKIGTRQPRRRKPRQGVDPRRGRMFDIIT